MSLTSKVAGTSLVPKGGEDISRLVEARRGKNFSTIEKILLCVIITFISSIFDDGVKKKN